MGESEHMTGAQREAFAIEQLYEEFSDFLAKGGILTKGGKIIMRGFDDFDMTALTDLDREELANGKVVPILAHLLRRMGAELDYEHVRGVLYIIPPETNTRLAYAHTPNDEAVTAIRLNDGTFQPIIFQNSLMGAIERHTSAVLQEVKGRKTHQKTARRMMAHIAHKEGVGRVNRFGKINVLKSLRK